MHGCWNRTSALAFGGPWAGLRDRPKRPRSGVLHARKHGHGAARAIHARIPATVEARKPLLILPDSDSAKVDKPGAMRHALAYCPIPCQFLPEPVSATDTQLRTRAPRASLADAAEPARPRLGLSRASGSESAAWNTERKAGLAMAEILTASIIVRQHGRTRQHDRSFMAPLAVEGDSKCLRTTASDRCATWQ